jgi:hypothetical protein
MGRFTFMPFILPDRTLGFQAQIVIAKQTEPRFITEQFQQNRQTFVCRRALQDLSPWDMLSHDLAQVVSRGLCFN